MSLWLTAARLAAAGNLAILLALGYVWGTGYRRHGAAHTLGLLTFAAFLAVENALWLYFYAFNPAFFGWFEASGLLVKSGVTMLCGLELVALVFVARITWL